MVIINDDIIEMHATAAYMESRAMFQAASQFNYLEMINPNKIPSHGITDYIYDNTQGPSCALATAPATFYRNWYLTTGDHTNHQMNGLKTIMNKLNENRELITIQNGYIIGGRDLQNISDWIKYTSFSNFDELEIYIINNMKIGITLDSQVVFNKHPSKEYSRLSENLTICNSWCSAIALGYDMKSDLMIPIASAVLKAAYKATLLTAILHDIKIVYLTMLGGGVFCNPPNIIINAIKEAVYSIKNYPIHIILLHYREYNKYYIDSLPEIK